jgi:hypothetical protein
MDALDALDALDAWCMDAWMHGWLTDYFLQRDSGWGGGQEMVFRLLWCLIVCIIILLRFILHCIVR